MKTFIAKSVSLIVPFDGASEELRISGTMFNSGYLPRLTENDAINNHWLNLGAQDCNFDLSLFKSLHDEDDDSTGSQCLIKATLNFQKDSVGSGSGKAHLGALLFEKIAAKLILNYKELRFIVGGLGATYTNKTEDSFTCRIQFEIHQSIFEFNCQ